MLCLPVWCSRTAKFPAVPYFHAHILFLMFREALIKIKKLPFLLTLYIVTTFSLSNYTFLH